MKRCFQTSLACLVLSLFAASCGDWTDSGEVNAYRYDSTKNCFHADDFVLVGPYKGRELNLDAPGCWIHPEKERLVFTKDLGPPYDKIREDGYDECPVFTSERPKDCATGEFRFDLIHPD